VGNKKKRNHRPPVAIKAELPVVAANEPVSVPKPLADATLGKRTLLAFGILLLVGASVYALVSTLPRQQKPPVAVIKVTEPQEPPGFDGSYIPTPLTYGELLKLSPDLLDKVNVGLMDLLCSKGLPGSENVNVEGYLNALANWASEVQRAEDSNSYRYDQSPGLYRHSKAYFKAVIMVSELNALGLCVDKERSDDEPNATFFAKSRPIFINGLLDDRHAGTCSSIPILVVAIAQRIGYPVKLVCNSNHFFARWDDGKDRFNIEATVTQGGMSAPPDAFYRYFPRMMKDSEMTSLGYLQNMDGRHQLAFILGKRLICLKVNGRKDEANLVYGKIKQLLPSVDLADLNGAFNLD
jgi:hypothetical protein